MSCRSQQSQITLISLPEHRLAVSSRSGLVLASLLSKWQSYSSTKELRFSPTARFPRALFGYSGEGKDTSHIIFGKQPSLNGKGFVHATFEGEKVKGTIELTPTKGDCISSPVTKIKGVGEFDLK